MSNIAVCIFASAQIPLPIGAGANGTGYTSSSVHTSWSLFNNPAGLALAEEKTFELTYDTDPTFTPFNRMAMAVSHPLLHGAASIGVFRFGDDLYNEQVIAGGYGNKFGITALGFRCSYLQLSAAGFGRKGVLTWSLGGITDLTSWLKIGAQIVNVNQPNVTDEEKLSTMVTLNAAVKASDKVWLFAEAEKKVEAKAVVKGGMQYMIHPKLFIRTGFHPSPLAAFFGFGIHLKKSQFDYAFSWRENSSRHQVSFQYALKKK